MTSYIEIDGWKQNIRFSSTHIITGHEKCGRLHGHTYAINTKIFGEKNKEGYIIDFSLIKSALKDVVNELDHKILIPEKNSSVIEDKKEVRMTSDGKTYVFPVEDCIFLPFGSITAENLAEYVLNIIISKIKFPKNIKKIEIGVDEGYGQGSRISKKL